MPDLTFSPCSAGYPSVGTFQHSNRFYHGRGQHVESYGGVRCSSNTSGTRRIRQRRLAPARTIWKRTFFTHRLIHSAVPGNIENFSLVPRRNWEERCG